MTTSKASGKPAQTVTPEHDTHEQPTAANYTAGDSFAKIVERWRADTNDDAHSKSLWDQGYSHGRQECADELEALAASHREPSTQQFDEALAVTQRAIIEAAERRGYERGLLDARPADKPADGDRVYSVRQMHKRFGMTPPTCQTCDDKRMIGGVFGQTPESFEEVTEACPDCKPAGQAVTDARDHAITDEMIAEWEAERGNGMISAVGEYTPQEFWLLLDEVKRFRGDAALAPEPATAGDEWQAGFEVGVKLGHPKVKELLSDSLKKATPAAAGPEGWQLVPVNSNGRMNEAGMKAVQRVGGDPDCIDMQEVWDAMRSAAPANRPADAQRGVPFPPDLTEAINAIGEYLAEREDADQELHESFPSPNREMRLRTQLQDAMRLAASPADPLPASEVSP